MQYFLDFQAVLNDMVQWNSGMFVCAVKLCGMVKVLDTPNNEMFVCVVSLFGMVKELDRTHGAMECLSLL